MADSVYRPFDRFTFNDQTCFLSGDDAGKEQMNVFPTWILDNYSLRNKPFKLLDESITTYGDIRVPCSAASLLSVLKLDNEVQDAFGAGYKAVKQLPEITLFQWIAKLVYGIIYHEIRMGIRQQLMSGERMNFSQSLIHKFGNFHLMLQSIIRPVVFEGASPWSILVYPVNNAPQTFSYRDEINTLTFSLRMNDFGIIACLQDNGSNASYHRNVLNAITEQPLHPIQFEELCGRFFYSAYLFNRMPEYTVLPTPEAVYIEPMPLRGMSNKPLFDEWQVKTYGQVLENFWKNWNFSLFEIIKDPEHPMSFILNPDGTFLPPPQIGLPL